MPAMSWSRRFRIRERVRGSLWLIPLVCAVLGAVLGSLLSELDRHVHDPYWTYSASTATSVLTSIVGATAALIGFVVTVTVLAVQMASGTFSPRYMRLWYRDGMLKATLGVLVGTLTLSFSLLRRVEDDFVPNVGVTTSGVLIAVSALLFLFFFDRVLHRLRPAAVAAVVAKSGRAALAESARLADRREIGRAPYPTTAEPSVVIRSSRAGVIQAVDPDGLVGWARRHDATVVLVHAVGDFVSTDGRLAQVYGAIEDETAAARELEGMVALGEERTIQQDPAFAIRIMVDIAIRALSPAVNDPTTAVQVLNHLGELLRLIGDTELRRPTERADAEGRPALFVPMRAWEDFLTLGVTEIREYGATSVQIPRRLRSMLEELHNAVSPANREAVERELTRLDATVEESWQSSVDRDLAVTADGQGIGGPAIRVRGDSP